LRGESTTLDGFSGEALNVAHLQADGDGSATNVSYFQQHNNAHVTPSSFSGIDVPNTTNFLRYSLTGYESSTGTGYFPHSQYAFFEAIEMDPNVLRYNRYEQNTNHTTALNGAGVGPNGAV